MDTWVRWLASRTNRQRTQPRIDTAANVPAGLGVEAVAGYDPQIVDLGARRLRRSQ